MLWFIIVGLLLVGLALLIVEIVFIPGTTVVGVLGVVFSITGIFLSYTNFGNSTGLYVLLVTLITTAIALYFSFKSGAWTAFALKSSIQSKVNEEMIVSVKVGDEGVSVSALRPLGKAAFGEKIIEVRTNGGYVEANRKVKIILIESSQVTVEIIN